MKRTDIISLIFLYTVVLVIYYPLIATEYLYTDDAGLVWFYKKEINLTFLAQGRWLTFRLFSLVFGLTKTIHNLMYARLFSLAGWMVCLPVWYYVIKKLLVKNGLPQVLAVLSMVYIVCMPPFIISVAWASCLQLFIACTCGLLSGYALYQGVQYMNGKIHFSMIATLAAMLFGIISLFTYQNGFGCFFIPFFIQFTAQKKISRNIYAAMAFSFLVYALYYLLFRYSLAIYGIEASDRSTLAGNPVSKLIFLFSAPLASAFHFTRLFNEKSFAGIIVYLIILFSWLYIQAVKEKARPLRQKLFYLAGVVIFFILIYLPSLLVKENYASHRTMFALDLAVFIIIAATVLSFLTTSKAKYTVAGIIIVLMLVNAVYNVRYQFLAPVVIEYNLVKQAVALQYSSKTDTVYIVRPPENAFVKKYNVIASWDEFGVPSTAKSWVAEPLIRQLVFEKTGNRKIAAKLVVISREMNNAPTDTVQKTSAHVLVIDVAAMLDQP